MSVTAVAIFLVLIPAALFCLFHFKKSLGFASGKMFLFTAGLSFVGFIMPFIVRGRLVGRQIETIPLLAGRMPVFFSTPLAGFYLTLLLYLLAMAVSVGFILAAKKNRSEESQ